MSPATQLNPPDAETPPDHRTLTARHLPVLRYWKDDYHYRNKVERRDVVFLSGLASLLAHGITQVLGALNRAYYPGDGNNVRFVDSLPLAPVRVGTRISEALYQSPSSDGLRRQRDVLVGLVEEVEALLQGDETLSSTLDSLRVH